MCAPALFPDSQGAYRFLPAWRARDSEIKTLARRGYAKKMKARRFETLHDTSLCKVLQSTRDGDPENGTTLTPEARTESRLLQIEIQRWFRQMIRGMRENAPAENPCNYGYPERMVNDILVLLSGGSASEHSRGIPLWHVEQLHVAEWQALQQTDYLFNLTLAVDAKNLAIQTLKAHKKAGSTVDAAEPFQPTRNIQAADDDELQAVALHDMATDEVPFEEETRGAMQHVTDKAFLVRLLSREDEVAQAKQPGQGRREALHCMKQAAEVFGSPAPWEPNDSEPSAFGAAEHEKNNALARHRTILEELRNRADPERIVDEASEERADWNVSYEGVELVQDTDEDTQSMDPVAFAKYLCDEAKLTREQRGPVALVARDMQKVYKQEQARRARLTEVQCRAEGIDVAESVTLPLKGRRLRLLLYGGGGCGKTRIINLVLAKLFRRFYGPKGLILTAFANKPARLIGGKTSHGLTKLRGGQSTSIAQLRVKSDKERRALAAIWAPAGALIKDEFTMMPGALEHAIAVRAMYGRERYHDLRCEDYARPQTNYAALPYVLTAGDPLQFPPVPATSSLLAEPEGQTKEHRIAQTMFEDQDYVCELKTTMRFKGDPVLSSILKKMRTPGEERSELRVTDEEWRVLQNTDVAHGASLHGTESWIQSAFAWSYVCMAQWNRSVESAKIAKGTLFMYAAKDYITNVDSRDFIAVRDKLFKIPNMNITGRLPAVLLLHTNMQVRCTTTICPCQAPVDTIGVVQNIELHSFDRERWQQHQSHAEPGAPEHGRGIFILHHAPTVLVKIDENTIDAGLGPGVIAVDKCLCQTFFTDVELEDPQRSTVRCLKVRAQREQLPLTIANASTLYTLQGSTAAPGLIYYFRTPRRLSNVMKWISCYMALSRLRTLRELRSIGLTPAIRELIDRGPPAGFLTRFLKVFEEKACQTQKDIEEALAEIGWADEEQ